MAHPLRAELGVWIRGLTVIAAAIAVGLAACATPGTTTGGPPQASAVPGGQYILGEPYEVEGVWYYPQEQPAYDETGLAGVYGGDRNGQTTANGEVFDPYAVTAAHPTLPMPVMVEVTNLDTGQTVAVRVNDRGAFGQPTRVIDLSPGAAEQLGIRDGDTATVRVRFLGPAPLGEPGQYAEDGAAQAYPPDGAPPPPGAGPAPGYAEGFDEGYAVPPEARGGGWTVQAGSFLIPANARRAVALLSRVAPAEVVQVQVLGRTYYRVILGPWPVAAEALRARDLAASAGFPDAIVRRPY